jgi:hypothetical protein
MAGSALSATAVSYGSYVLYSCRDSAASSFGSRKFLAAINGYHRKTIIHLDYLHF